MLSVLKWMMLPYGAVFRERRPGLVLLIYHRVGGGTRSDIDLPRQLFERQMAHLQERYTPVALDALLDDTLPPSPRKDLVAVTFDDGFAELADTALPALVRYRVPATVYLATRYVEEQRPFDFGAFARDARRPPPLSWRQLREMAATGLVDIGAHTHSHVDVTRIAPDAVREELARSRALIEDRVGRRPRHFAYPWGAVNREAKSIVAEYFATAARGGSGKNLLTAIDRYALWRRPVQQNDGYRLFTLKAASYLDGEEALRQLAARVRR